MNSRRIVLVCVMFVLIVATLLLLTQMNNPVDPNGGGSDTPQARSAYIERFVRATSLLENLRPERALADYAKLKPLDSEKSSDAAVLQNSAIAILSQLETESDLLKGTSLTVAEQAQMRAKAPKLFEQLNSLLLQEGELEPDNVDVARLNTLASEQKIKQLPTVMAKPLQRDLVRHLLEDLKKFPGDAVLAAKLMATIVTLSPNDLKAANVTDTEINAAIQTAWEKNPRNMFLLNALALRKIDQKDASVVKLIEPAIELAEPQLWLMSLNSNDVDPTKVLRDSASNAEKEPQEFFITFSAWLNLLLGTSILSSDARATADISPLALIRYDPVYTLLQAKKIDNKLMNRSAKMISIRDLPIDKEQAWHRQDIQLSREAYRDITDVAFFDWNLDLTPELLIADTVGIGLDAISQVNEIPADNDETLTASKLTAETISGSIQTICVADLFEVKSQLRSEIVRKPNADLSEEEQIKPSDRHSTLQDVVLGLDQGVQILTLKNAVDIDSVSFELVDRAATGLPTQGSVQQILPVDIEADGDLDLLLVIDGNVQIFVNRGNRTFYDASEFSVMPNAIRKVTAIAACDFDFDIDIDVIIAFEDGVGRLENLQHGQFRFVEMEAEWLALSGARQLLFADLDGNVSWDWIARKQDAVEIIRTSTVNADVRVIDQTSLEADALVDIKLFDLNYDSRQDLILADSNGWQILWQDLEKFAFSKASEVVEQRGLQQIRVEHLPLSNQTKILGRSGTELTLWSRTEKLSSNAINIRVKGISDENGGGRINEYAIGTLLQLYSPNAYQARVIDSPNTTFSVSELGGAPYSLRIIFPNGLTQTVLDPPVDSMIEEVQELKGSCPFLYGWDGQKWQMITDCLWNAPLGLQVARGKLLPGRRWEYLSLPRELMQIKDGGYEIRLTEELWEAAYFDQVELMTYDHPANSFVLSNEKVGPGNIAQPGLWTFDKTLSIENATDSNGHDVSDQLHDVDGRFAVDFEPYRSQGVVPEYTIDLPVDTSANRDNLQLVLTGWLHPTDTSMNIGLDQNPQRAGSKPPALFAVNADGTETLLQEFMGFPGGKTKTIVVDLSAQLNDETAAVRIRTSAELYWDQAHWIEGQMQNMNIAKSLQLESAELHYRGFSALKQRARNQPHMYDYARVSTVARWLPMNGLFTRFGDCRSIVEQDDDRLVIMGAGDELSLRFAVPDAALKQGWVRDFVLHSTGWDKDADLNTVTGQSSMPVPFAAMQSYPPPTDQYEESIVAENLNAETLTRLQSPVKFWRNSN